MEYKRNEATDNRPEGDRVIDAPFVFTDIGTRINQLREEEAWQKNDRNGITVFKTDHLSIVLVCLHEKAFFDNLVDGIFTIQVLEGKVRVRTMEGDMELRAGNLVTFHPGVAHTIEATDEAVLLFTNSTAMHAGNDHGHGHDAL